MSDKNKGNHHEKYQPRGEDDDEMAAEITMVDATGYAEHGVLLLCAHDVIKQLP